MKTLSILLSLVLAGCGASAEATTYAHVTASAASPQITAAVTMTQTTSGVAPAMVWFDASATTASSTSSPYRDLKYTWDFNDSTCASGNWTYGAAAQNGTNWARNVDIGFETVHVYECAGTFHPVLTVTDGTNTNTWTGTVTVVDADTNYATTSTICLSNASSFTGCPSGATQVSSSNNAATAVSTYGGANKRILFERGGTWTDSASIALNNSTWTGMTIGAYGSGAKPIISYAGGQLFNIGQNGTSGFKDLRIMDLSLSGGTGVAPTDTFFQILWLRNDLSMSSRGFQWDMGGAMFDGDPMPDFSVLQDNTITLTGGSGNSFYGGYTHVGLLGNSFDNAGHLQQTIRMIFADPGVIQHNHILNAGSTEEDLKLHGPTLSGSGSTNWHGPYYTPYTATKNVEISDNYISSGSAATTNGVVIGPQNSTSEENVEYVVYERNWQITGSSPTHALLMYGGGYDSIRNNIFDTSASAGINGTFEIAHRGIEETPRDIQFINNTLYSSAGMSDSCFRIEYSESTDIIKNNICYYASGSIWGGAYGASGVTASNNTGNFGTLTTSPNFTSTSPFNISNAKITAGSYAIGNGATVNIWQDGLGAAEPSPRDIGAVNH